MTRSDKQLSLSYELLLRSVRLLSMNRTEPTRFLFVNVLDV